MKKTKISEIIFNTVNFLIMAFMIFVCIYPLWYVLIASFSGASAVTEGRVLFWIEDFTLEAYKKTLATPYIGTSYLNTIFYSIVGTFMSLVFIVLGAYPLSRKQLHGKTFLAFFIAFTMRFSGGMMPTYVIYRTLHLLDSRLGVLFNGMVATMNVIIMRTAFQGVPDSLEESMKLDGANDIQVLIHTYLPLTVPTLMTLALFCFVGRWNEYLWPSMLLKTETKIPLQVLLRKLVVEMTGLYENLDGIDISVMSKETVVYSTMVIAVVPMLVIYPFIQKFFTKGVMVGAIKG